MMRTNVLVSAALLLLLGSSCREDWSELPDGSCSHVDLKGSQPADMTTAGPNCLAASGLLGDRLVCVDFNQNTASPFTNDPKLSGWDFMSFGGNCWTIKNGKLQINTSDFTTYKQSCGFMMAPLNSAEFAKYSSFTLSIIHTLDISDNAQQKAQLMMGSDDPQNRLIDQSTGRQPRKQWVQILSKAALPGGAAGPYQPLFKFAASQAAGGTAQGWQIESIAVLGLQ